MHNMKKSSGCKFETCSDTHVPRWGTLIAINCNKLCSKGPSTNSRAGDIASFKSVLFSLFLTHTHTHTLSLSLSNTYRTSLLTRCAKKKMSTQVRSLWWYSPIKKENPLLRLNSVVMLPPCSCSEKTVGFDLDRFKIQSNKSWQWYTAFFTFAQTDYTVAHHRQPIGSVHGISLTAKTKILHLWLHSPVVQSFNCEFD